MPYSKNAYARYKRLDSCFRSNQYYYIEDLIDACNDVCSGVSRRQIYEDIKYMKSSEGWEAPIEAYNDGKRKYYRYSDKNFSIEKKPITEQEMHQLQEMILMLSRFNDVPQFKLVETLVKDMADKYKIKLKTADHNIISLDNNQYTLGNEKIPEIYDAIINKIPLRIEYQTFHKGMRTWIIHPYFLRQYNSRWYLIGVTGDCNKDIAHIGLDRIKNLEVAHVAYIENTFIENIDEYFEDVVGVSITEDRRIEHIVLQFSEHRFPYVKAKPIHGSQKIPDEENRVVSLDLIINKELESILLSFGEDIEVIEPKWFRDVMAAKIRKTYEKYFGMQ